VKVWLQLNLTYSPQRQYLYHKYLFVIHSVLDQVCIAVLLTSGRVRMSAVKWVVHHKPKTPVTLFF